MPRRSTATWTLVVTSVAGFMAALDNLVVTTALPSIRHNLGGALEDLEWTVSAYTLTFAVLLMFGAALGDRFGRRRMFGAGVALFTAASAAAALAPGMGELIAARAEKMGTGKPKRAAKKSAKKAANDDAAPGLSEETAKAPKAPKKKAVAKTKDPAAKKTVAKKATSKKSAGSACFRS